MLRKQAVSVISGIQSYKSKLSVVKTGICSILLSGCVAQVSISPLSTQSIASFSGVSSYIQSTNVSQFTLSGICTPQDSLVIKARTQGQSTDITLTVLTCAADSRFSTSKDLSSFPEGNVEFSLHDSKTDKSLSTLVVTKDTIAPTTTLLSPPPATNNLTTIISGISTTDTLSYSFKFSTLGSVDCAIDSGYSAYIPVATSMNENIAMMLDGSITLCLRGQDAASNIQSPATAYTWTKNTSYPTATLTGFPATDTNIAAQTGSVGGAGVTNYKYKFGLLSLINCADSSGYSATTPVASPITVIANSNSAFTLCVLGENALGSWQPAASATAMSWTYDSTAPILTITSPAAASYVNASNQAAYTVTTSCSENNRSVQFTASSTVDNTQSTASGTCLAGTVSVNFNLSSFPEGGIQLSATQTDVAGNTGTSATVNVSKDTTPPVLGGSLTHAAYSSSTSATPSMSWSAATDIGGSGVQKYQVAIGTTSGGVDALAWTDIGNLTTYQVTGLTLVNGTKYYPQVRAVDNAGQASIALISAGGFTVDTSGPDVSAVTLTLATDTWSITDSPTLSWNSATDSVSGVSSYEVSIGSAAGLSDVKAWTSVGNVNSTTITGLALTRGTTYYANLRAVDAAGNYSSVVNGGNGWLVDKELLVANGTVYSIIKSGTTLYLGGSFSKVGPWTGGGVPISATDGSLQWPNTASRARVNGTVSTVIADGSGGFYIGGTFTKIGNTPRINLAHILANGSVDPNLNATFNSGVTSLLLSGTTLYVGGSFSLVNGLSRNYLVAFSTTDGSLSMTFLPTPDNSVYCLALSGTTLYLGGDFFNVGGAAHIYVAAVSAINGAVIPGFTASTNSSVWNMLVNGSTLYLAGNFSKVDTVNRNGIGAVSATTGALVNAFNPSPNSSVVAMQISGTTLYIGGSFTTVGGTSRSRIAAVSTTDGSLIPTFNPNADDYVFSLLLSGTTLYMGGYFNTVGGTARSYLAAVSTTDGSLISGLNASADGHIYSIAQSGSILYLGGSLTSVGAVTRNNLAAISTDGTLISTFNPNVNNTIMSMLMSGTNLYLGGFFTAIGGTPKNYLAAISSVDGSLVPGFSADTNNFVTSLTTDGTNLFVGGYFTSIGGSAKNRIAEVTLTNGSVVAGFNPNANDSISTMTVSGTTLYLGGAFTSIGGTGRNYMAAVSTTDGSVIPGFNPNCDNSVSTLLLSGTTLYAGGSFTTIGGASQSYLGAVSTTNGAAIAGFTPTIDGSVTALLLSGSSLYVGGSFSSVGGLSRANLAAVSSVDGSVNAIFNPDFNSTAFSFTAYDSALYFGWPGAPVDMTTGARIPDSF